MPIALLVRLAEEFETPIHIVHLSSAQALPLLAEARGRGVPVTVETCAQYLWFAAEDIPDGATEFKCAPPIRGAANREALWDALAEGVIDMVTTDHSPCPPAMKRRDEGRWDHAWGGISSLGLALPVFWTAMVRRGLDPGAGLRTAGAMDGCGTGTARRLGGRKGTLAPGADADFVVFDPDAEWTVTQEHLHFRHKLSPYLGAKLHGRVQETWLRGAQIFSPVSRSLERTLRRRCARQRVGALMKDRALRVIAECQTHRRHDRRARPHHAPVPTPPGARGSCPPAPSHGGDGHDCPRGCGRQSARTVAAGKRRASRLVMGSHIDTVPDAGAYDGVLGVVMALEWVQMAQET